jgi:hypothetical protein
MNENEIAALNAKELINVSDLAYEVGYPKQVPSEDEDSYVFVFITPRVYMNWCFWTDQDTDNQIIQLKEERIWNILYNAYLAIQKRTNEFKMKVIPRDGVSIIPIEINLRVAIIGFAGKPDEIVILIQEPNEDINTWSSKDK